MFDAMRTAAGAAPLVPTALAPGPHGLLGFRALAHALRQAVLQAGEPPQHSGIHPLHWKMASPQQRAQLLRRQHFHGVFARHHGALTPAHAFKAQGVKAHGFWRLTHHGLRLGSHSLHGSGLLRKVAAALHAAQAASTQPAAAPAAAPAAPAASAPAAPLAQGAKTEAEAAQLAQITQQFQARFAQSAKDPAAFAALLKQAFGDHYDAAKAEVIRQQSLAGDFSWCPKIQLADAAQMRDLSGTQAEGVAQGCYVKSEDTVLINRELLARDPAQAEKILAEEVGHALDVRLNTSDAAGDEGDIFSKLVHGETISASDLAAMKADNDHGVIEINGKKEEVEYGWFKKLRKALSGGLKKVFKAVTNGIKNGFKAAMTVAQGLVTMNFQQVQQGLQACVDAVKDTVKDVAKAVKDTAKAIHKIVKDAVIKLMQSKLFNAILMVCRFIPIPIVALVVRIIDVVKAAYMVYQGIKNKSWGAVLSGVATIAGGVSNVAGALGAGASTVSTIQGVADAAKTASMVYSAASSKNFAQAALLGAQALGAPQGVIDGLKTAQQVQTVVQGARAGDYLGAASVGVAVFGQNQSWSEQANTVIKTAQQIDTVARAVRTHDYAAAAQAGATLLDRQGESGTWSEGLKTVAQTAAQANAVYQAVRHGDASAAVQAGAQWLDKDAEWTPQLQTLLQGAQAVRAMQRGRYEDAEVLAAGVANKLSPALQSLGARLTSAPQGGESAAQVASAQPGPELQAGDDPAPVSPVGSKATLRQMEQAYRQDNDEGASSVSYRKQDQGLYGMALRAAGGNQEDALALLGLWKQDGVKLNANGSPIVKEGQALRYTEVSQIPPEDRLVLQRDGALLLRNNSVVLERKREAQARAEAARKEDTAAYKQALSELRDLSTGLKPTSASPAGAARSEPSASALPPIENLYQPVEGVMQRSYRQAVAGLTDPNSSALDKGVYTVLGAAVLPLSMVEGVVTSVINAPNAAARAGQHLAAADLATEPSEQVSHRLAAVAEGAEAFTGLGGVATLGAGAQPQRLRNSQVDFRDPGTGPARSYEDLTSSKLTFDSSLTPADKVTAVEVGKALAENPIASAYYGRLQRQGTEVRFVSDAPSDLLGLYDGNRNTVTVNVGAHTSASEAVSTIVHEATHQNRYIEKGLLLGTQAEEYVAFRNEMFFQTGKRPSLQDRQQLIEAIVKPLYSDLPEGKLPKFGAKP